MSSAIISIFFVSLTVFSTSVAVVEAKPTAYEILESYDFPVGILPKGVTSYDFDETTGKFTVYLNKTCTFSIEGYNLKYKSKITGVITKHRLSNLTGVQVHVLFIWLTISEVSRDGDQLDFSLGVVSADFPIDNFFESPKCGCGFDCNEEIDEIRFFKFNRNRLVSLL